MFYEWLMFKLMLQLSDRTDNINNITSNFSGSYNLPETFRDHAEIIFVGGTSTEPWFSQHSPDECWDKYGDNSRHSDSRKKGNDQCPPFPETFNVATFTIRQCSLDVMGWSLLNTPEYLGRFVFFVFFIWKWLILFALSRASRWNMQTCLLYTSPSPRD